MSNLRHGYRHTRLYRIWTQIKTRCNNSNYEHFNRYGGRGIKICNEWSEDFSKFKDWAIQNGYDENLEIDRIDNDGNYEPDNCRWQSRVVQVRNRSNTVYLEHDRLKKPLKEWCEMYGVNYKLAHQRYRKGWDFERVFNL